MSYKSASTSIISAGTTESSQSRSFNYPDGPGVVITGSQVTSESASYKMIVEAGQGQTFTVIGGGGGANITIDGIDYLDSSNVVAGNAVSTLGGNILIRGSGFAGDLRVIVGGSSVSNSIINTAAIFSTLSANSAGNVDLFIFEGSNVGVISPEQVRYSGAPVWTTTSFEVTEGIAANVELVASSDSTLTYSILSGSGNLPVGFSLVSSGYISGTANGYVSGGSGQVTIVATDQEDQASQQVITWTVLSAADQNFYRTVLSLNADGVEPFCSDASDNNFQLTVVGDTRPNRMSPYWPGGWSAYFDGTGDWLTLPSTFNAAMGGGWAGGQHTVEMWVYPTQWSSANSYQHGLYGTYAAVAANGRWWVGLVGQASDGPGKLAFIYTISTGSQVNNIASVANIPVNTWTHIAVTIDATTSSSTTIKFFVNGTLTETYTSQNFTTQTTNYSAPIIGGNMSQYVNNFIGYTSNLRQVYNSLVYTENFTPSTTPLEPIAGTVLLTLRDSAFLDDGPYRFTITRAGDTKITTVSPFNTQPYTLTPDSYSGYFDGTGDYLSIAHNSAQNLGAVDFTVECWFCQTGAYNNYSTGAILAKSDTGATKEYIFNVTSTAMGIEFYGTSAIQTSVTYTPGFTMGVWYHIAYVRQGGTLYYYVNGTQIGSTNLGAGYTFTAITIEQRIGRNNNSTYNFNFNGYISNLRVVKGTAVYTSNFTPPTAPLSAISGTSLLTCQSTTFVDNSTNNFTITANGNSQPTAFNPFGETITAINNYSYDSSLYSASGYFDGTGDTLTTPSSTVFAFGTGNWTMEAWVFLNAYTVGAQAGLFSPSTNNENCDIGGTTNSPGKLSYYNGGTGISSSAGVVPVNSWAHIAFVRIGGTVDGYVNGVRVLTGSISAPNNTSAISFTIGTALNGYVSNARIVKGTALYTGPFVPPASPLTAVTNTSLLTLQRDLDVDNSGFVDVSSNNLLITRAGNATQGSASPYAPSGWSAYFDGSGDRILVSSSVSNVLNRSAFTIETWCYLPSNSTATLFDFTASADNYGIYAQHYNGDLSVQFYSSTTAGSLIGTISYSFNNNNLYNTWVHVAVTYNGSVYRLFINGNQVGSVTSATQIVSIGRWTVGARGNNTVTQPWLGYISNFRVVSGTALYTSNFSPPTTPATPINQTVLLLNSSGIVDSGPNRYTLAVSGDVKIVPLSPFVPQTVTPDSYSGYFDGSGDYLTLPDSESFAFGSDNFTIECWVYSTSSAGERHIVGQRANSASLSPVIFGTKSGGIYMLASDGSSWIVNSGFASGSTVPLDSWAHIAMVRNGSSFTAYVNGVAGQTATSSATLMNSTAALSIGAGAADGNSPWIGYISNFRIVKGTAVYTSNFTPPAAPLTAISDTSLLTCQSTTFVDNSTNAFAITVNGNAQPTTLNPFGSTVTQDVTAYTDSSGAGSAYFDGSGDYLSVPTNPTLAFGTGDFTIEFWMYVTGTLALGSVVYEGRGTSSSTAGPYIANNGQVYIGGSSILAADSSITANNWIHFALTRQGTSLRRWINGVQTATATNSTSLVAPTTELRIATNDIAAGTFAGYISNLRVVKGTALYTGPFVPPAQPLTAVANTSLLLPMTNGAIYDATERNVLETVGNTRIDTSVKKFGTGSMYFDGTGDYLVMNPSDPSLFAFGTGDFTIEFWVNPASASSNDFFIDFRPSNTQGAYITLYRSGGQVRLFAASADRITASSLTANAWSHIAVTRSGTATKLFINGTQSGSTYTDSNNYINSTSRPVIGASGFNLTESLNGYIDDLRITKGYARYVANFTPPDIPNPAY